MIDDDFSLDVPEDEEFDEGGASNRTFMMVAGGIGGLILISLICLAVYALVILPRQQADEANTAATQTEQAYLETVDMSLTQTSIVLSYTPTASNTPIPSNTPTATTAPTETPVSLTSEPQDDHVTATATEEGAPTIDPRTVTVQALLTQAAQAQTQAAGQLTTSTVTPTLVYLPDTGFWDDAAGNLPMLIALVALLMIVIFMARRLRQANA